MDRIADLIELFETNGKAQYGREAVSQTEHALQCAVLAEAEGAGPALVAAALLHDVGHLLAKPRDNDEDDKHEDIGWGFLKSHFVPGVAEPVHLHVPAKRYLCTVEPAYFDILSPASVRSLEIQGGRFTSEEVAMFRHNPHAADAVRVRRWDDKAKTPGVKTKVIGDYADLLRGLSR